jgi:hypothetical protein
LTAADIKDVKRLQPEGWPDILPSIQYYFHSPISFPFKAVLNNKIVGLGTAIIHGRTGWLAHIIVDKESRNAGIGTSITKHLIKFIQQTSCETMLLVATALGEPVYKKFGFETETEYVSLENGTLPVASDPKIVPYREQYTPAVLAMDLAIYGEDRRLLLSNFLKGAYLYVQGEQLLGFYIPTLGDGLILSENKEVGLELMKKRAELHSKFCLPIQNQPALEFLGKHNFVVNRKAARMILGKKFSWDGRKIYNRVGGNLG